MTAATLPDVILEPFDGEPDVSSWFENADWVSPETYHWQLKNRVGLMHLAWLNDQPVAFVHTDGDYVFWGAPTYTLVVDPARRGEGIGAATLRALSAQVSDLTDERIIGKIYTANTSSIRAAERAGWTVSSRGEDTPDEGGPWVVVQSRPAE